MIEQIREKNRIRLVTAAFRGKFLREPSSVELSHWIAIFQADANLPRFLTKITQATASREPLSDAVIATATIQRVTQAGQETAVKSSMQNMEHGKLGARARFFLTQLRSDGLNATSQGGI